MYRKARDLFEAARDAASDALRCEKQIEVLEEDAVRVSSPSLTPSGRRAPASDRMANKVATLVDRKNALDRRIDEDYRLIDAACEILYGADGMSDGLATIAPPWWADAIYHHYLGLSTWDETADRVMFSKRYVQTCVCAAFDLMDANGMASTVEGIGYAEG